MTNIYKNPSASKGLHFTAPRRPRPGNQNANAARPPSQRKPAPPPRPVPSLYEYRLEKALGRLGKITWLLGDDDPRKPDANARRAATIARVGRLVLAEERYGLITFLIPRLRRAIRDQWTPSDAAQAAYAEVRRLTAELDATAHRDDRIAVYAQLFAAWDVLDIAADMVVTLPPIERTA